MEEGEEVRRGCLEEVEVERLRETVLLLLPLLLLELPVLAS